MAAFDPPVIFGLAVKNNLSDIRDKDKALLNLGLLPADLSIFGGINKIASNDSFQALSNTGEPLDLTLTRLARDSEYYSSVINEGMDINDIQGNLTINGILAASAIRYYTLDLYDETLDKFQPVDISTSRVSSWSNSFDGDKLIYGGELKVTKNSVVSAGSIKFGTASELVNFPYSEVATHVIKLSSNNKVYSVYAMKDIPLIIEGYFATAPAPNISCQVSLGNFVTFKCYRPDYLLEPPVISRPLNLSATPPRTRNLPIYRAASRRRIIEIYTSPAAFEILTLTNIGVRSFPETFLPNLFALNLSFNNFTKLPESLNKSTPTLQTLNISHNPLKTESPILTRDLAARLPTGLVNLSIGNTYESIEIFDDNGVQKSVFELFPLKFLDIAGLATKLTGILPSVSGSCEIYNASNNNFTSLPERGLLRPQAENNLKRISLNNNRNLTLTANTSAMFLNNSNFSEDLEEINISSTQLPIPDMRSSTNLLKFSTGNNSANTYTGSLSSLREEFNLHTAGGNYKFNNCNKLTTLYSRYGDIFGELPIFTNNSLAQLTIDTSLSGVKKPSGVEDNYSLYTDTFARCKETLTSILFTTSNQNFPELPLQEGSLDLPNLQKITWQTMGFNRVTLTRASSGGATGDTPEFTGNINKLTDIDLFGNRFSNIKPISNSISNSLLSINMGANSLTHTNNTEGLDFSRVFEVPFNNLQELNLQHNMFSSVDNIVNTPNITTLDISYNNLSGAIPDLGNVRQLRTLNLRNNKFTRFTKGAFDRLTKIRNIDLSNNIDGNTKTLSVVDIENIIQSLFNMYANSSSLNKAVTINLKSGDNYTLESSTAIAQARFLTNTAGPRYTISGIVIPKPEI